MPDYEITSPDGKKFVVTAPDGATQEQVLAYAQEQFAQAPAKEAGILESIDQAIQSNPIGATIAEGAAAVNRGASQVADFLTTTPINSALELAGSESRVPSITETLAPATAGNFMEAGVPRDIVRAAGEVVPGGIAAGSLLRGAAGALNPAMLSSGEAVTAGAVRQLGQTTIGQDAAYAGLSGAGGAVGQEIGGDTGGAIGAALAPIAPAAAAAVGGGALKRMFGGDGAARVIDDFASFGEVPTAGMASGKAGLQGAENISASAIGGAPLARKSESIANSIQQRLAKIADYISTKEGAENAGMEIQKGITGKNGFIDRFRSTSSVLWNKSDSLIDKSLPVSLANTRGKLDQLVRGGKVGPILDNQKLVELKSVLDDPAPVDYQTLRDIRSSIGQKLGSNELLSDIPRSELKQIYGALSQDIKTIASQSSPQALQAFNRANKYTSSGHDRVDDYLQRIANKVNPDEVFKAIAKGGEGTKSINVIKKSLKPEEWEVVASNVVRKLGRSPSGQQNAVGDDALGDAFSVDKFVTDWNKLGPARKSIFSGSDKIEAYGDDLSKIARAASVVKDAGRVSRNASGTAQAASKIAAGTGLATSVVTANPTILAATAASLVMNNAGARLMSNPRFVKWLAQSAKIPASRSSAAIGGLVGVANQSSADDAALIQSLAEELESNTND
jgi:hypothetical protein